MIEFPAISRRIWDMKYRLKTAADEPVEKTLEATWARVAKALARPEKDRKHWQQAFAAALEGFQFLPAGRILAGAGTGRAVTLFNCFVMGRIPDDMGGIFTQLREAALTLQQGGGIGYDFSTLRPAGAEVRGVGADASGPLSFMDVWDAMCRTIMSAGARRGAMMATLRADHPDIEAFIEAKREPGRLRMFNLSVLVSDALMAAVKDDRPWPLVFEDKTYGNLRARALWDKIMEATYAYAEPGVIFIDRINRRNNLSYCETIDATNPCVVEDTWVHTSEGPRQVRDLIGRAFTALVEGQAIPSGPEGFFATGRKRVFRLVTEQGYSLRLTADHPLRCLKRNTRHGLDYQWRKAGELAPGDRVFLHNHGPTASWPGRHGEPEGYLIGLLLGSGTLEADRAVLTAWPGRQVVNGGYERPGVLGVMEAACSAARGLPGQADFSGWRPDWREVAGGQEMRLGLTEAKQLTSNLGLRAGEKRITKEIEQASSAFYCGFLRGIFDAEASLQRSPQTGTRICLTGSDHEFFLALQRMLLRLGIRSCHEDLHELVIGKADVFRFAERIGFADSEKSVRLKSLLSADQRESIPEGFLATIDSIEEDGLEMVFDVRVPGVNAFDANGFFVHNCGEQPLPPYGACLLGSINLARLVDRPFEPEAEVNLARLESLVPTAVRMLDNAIDISRFPLKQQKHEALTKRRIGLGITGLADALIFCGARYGSAEAVALTKRWMSVLRRSAYGASIALAEEKGAFPLFDREDYLAGETIRELDPDLREAIAKHGIRNALVTSIAPTGTISLLAGNVSSGIEPVFAFTAQRAILRPDGKREQEEVSDYAYRLFRERKGPDAPLPAAFVDSQSLDPADHLAIQAAVQAYVDASVSKTINLSAEIAFEDFKSVYRQAFESGCKGCTTYRPNAVTGAVLQTLPQDDRASTAREADGVVYMSEPLGRPQVLPGRTYKLRWPESDHAIYLTINDVMQEGRRRPFEIFINSKNMEHYAWTLALTRMISAVFRRGGDVSFVVEELKAVFDPRGGAWLEGRYVPSLLAAIGGVIERHLIEIGFLPNPEADQAETLDQPQVVNLPEGLVPPPTNLRQCPKCGELSLLHQEGCDLCTACNYSKCL